MNKIKSNDIIIDIEKFVFGGEALGFYEGKPVFVSNAIPGEKVDLLITESKNKYLRGTTKKIIKKSPKRVKPICKYFEKCGGCDYMMIDDNEQMNVKKEIVYETLNRIGKIKNFHISAIIQCSESNYRNKSVYQICKENDKVKIGFFKRKSNKIVDIDYCLIQSEKSNETIKKIKEILNEVSINIYGLKKIEIRKNNNCEIMINFIVIKNMYNELLRIGKIISKDENVISIYQTTKKNERVIDSRLILGKKYITEKLFENYFNLYPNSFYQVNSHQIEKLYNIIIEYLKKLPKKNIIDAFSGVGTIGISLSKFAKKIICIESNGAAVKIGIDTAKSSEITNVEFVKGKVEDTLNKLIRNNYINMVILDPPRKGVDSKVLDEIIAGQIAEIVYISCNPSTFARDLKILNENSYTLEDLKIVDMFPYTQHIECVGIIKIEK